MNRYENEICPGCGKVICDGDDIVVCPECATPQHRECYNKLGSCVNGYLHASGYVWQPENKKEQESEKEPEPQRETEQTVICPYCGEENPPRSLHCNGCGNMLPQNAPQFRGFAFNGGQEVQGVPGISVSSLLSDTGFNENDPIGDETAGDEALYVRRSQKKFLPVFGAFTQNEKKKVSWNWAAFLLAPYYFFYRRMMKVGVAFACVFLAISLIATPSVDSAFEECYKIMEASAMTENADEAQMKELADRLTVEIQKSVDKLKRDPIIICCAAAILICRITAGLLADRLYFKKSLRDIKAVRSRYPDPRIYKGLLYRVGGVSPLNFISSIFLMQIAGDALFSLAQFFAR